MKAKRECPSCGRVLGEHARFCVGCGAELPEPAEVTPAAEPVAQISPPASHPDPVPVVAAAVPEPVPAAPPVAAPVPPPPPPPPPPPGGAMVAAGAEGSRPQFDLYAGELPPPGEPPPPPPGGAAPATPERPDVNLLDAVRRLARRSPLSAGIAAGLIGVAGVSLQGLAVGGLVRAAHGSQGCSAGALSGTLQGGCQQVGSTNGLLTDWNAMLWSMHGVGVSFSSGIGGLVVRIPLGLGMLFCGMILSVAGAISVRLVAPRTLRDIFIRAGVVAVSYTVGMLIVGIVITARGNLLNVGPDSGLLLLWALIIGYLGSLAGMFRRLFGAAVPRPPLATLRSRMGGWSGVVEAGLMATAAAVVLGAVLGGVGAATHLSDAGTVLRTAVGDVTTRQLPSSPTGTVATVVYLILGLPTMAAWVLAYSLIIPTVTVGTPLGTTDYGLLAGDHDAWLWAVVALPIVVTLLAGHIASRRRNSSSVETALLDGALGGLAFAVIAFLLVVLLDGGGTLSVAGFGGVLGGVPGGDFLFGPGMQYSLGALLLWGLVGGAAGGYLSLLLRVRGVRLPFLQRYEPVPGAPLTAAAAVAGPPCATCGLAMAAGARFCSACGTSTVPPPVEV